MMLKKLLLSLLLSLFLSSGVIAYAADKINVNTATQEELQTLSGVGETTAMAIIDYREQVGKLTSVDSLLEVKGIGEKKLDKLRDQLTVSEIE